MVKPSLVAPTSGTPRLYAHLDTNAYILAAPSVQAATETLLIAANKSFTSFDIILSDLSLGGTATMRVFWGSWTEVDLNGAGLGLSYDSVNLGMGYGYHYNDGGSLMASVTTNPTVVIDQKLHLAHYSDTKVGTSGRIDVSIDGAVFASSGAYWVGADTNLGWYTPGGDARGSSGGDPAVTYSPLGWKIFHCVCNEDLTLDRAVIYAAFNDVLTLDPANIHGGVRAMLGAIETAVTVPLTNIVYAEEFYAGSKADWGASSARYGVKYTLPVVVP